jgi:hypothetical protein
MLLKRLHPLSWHPYRFILFLSTGNFVLESSGFICGKQEMKDGATIIYELSIDYIYKIRNDSYMIVYAINQVSIIFV